MLIKDRVFLFEKEKEKYKNFKKKVIEWNQKSEQVIKYSAELLGIKEKDLEDKITISTNNELLINNQIAEKYGFESKITVIGTENCAIKKDGKYLGQWSILKKNNKIYKQIEKYINEEIELDFAPDSRDHFLGNDFFSRVHCRVYDSEKYGYFFIIGKEEINKDEKMQKELKEAKELKLSEYYKMLEEIDSEE